jgi:hypothetical protein
LKNFVEKKSHNMLALILNPRFKSFCLVSSFIVHDQGVAIVEQHDTMSLYPMFMRCYYHLHPPIEFNNGFVDQKVYDDNNLDIFQMTIGSIELTKELLVFQHYLVDVKGDQVSLSMVGET